MTEDMLQWERACVLFGDLHIKTKHDVKYVEDTRGKVNLECSTSLSSSPLNFKGGATSQYVACNVMAEVDRQDAREMNLKQKVEGTTAVERLQKITKKITSGKLMLDVRQSHLDINVMSSVKKNFISIRNAKESKRCQVELNYLKLYHNGDKVVEKHGNRDVSNWNSKADIQTYLKPLRNTKDSKMPDDKDELIQRFNLWKNRSRKDITTDQAVLDDFDIWRNLEEEKLRGKQSKQK